MDEGDKWGFLWIGSIFVVLWGFVLATAGPRPQVGWGLFVVVVGVAGIIYGLARQFDDTSKGG